MATYSQFQDVPYSIKREGQEISLKFERTSDTTGTISWNIPAPANGCSAATQAYNGIVITGAFQPANYISTSPQDGKFYTGDPSVDNDLHAGDKLDGALVLTALYDDKITTFIQVNDLKPKTAYYFSGYAVDNVARYHREGVHAYSLPTGPSEANGQDDLPAIQDVGIDTADGITPSTLTGLDANTTYSLQVRINNKKYDLIIPGNQALDYDDLIYRINQEFIKLTEPKFSGPLPPNTNNFYVDIINKKVFKWNGSGSDEQNVIFLNADPSVPVAGTYWFNQDTNQLFLRGNTGWNLKEFKESPYDFSNPKCYQYWVDGTNVYKWEKVLWCLLPSYISIENPLNPPLLDCNTFWYNENTQLLQQRNTQLQKWEPVTAITSKIDPNNIPSGYFWYDTTNTVVKFFAGSVWNILTNITYIEPDSDGNFPNNPKPNQYWFIPSSMTLFRRDPSNTVWIEQDDLIIYDSDPRDRNSCELWWNIDSDILMIWDIINNVWKNVSMFYQTDTDPSLSTEIPLNSAWYNPDTKILTIINNPDCTTVGFVFSETDPTIVNFGDIWKDTVNNKFFVWNGSSFTEVAVITKNEDPYIFSIGELWFSPASGILKIWNGSSFTEISYSLIPLTPKIGELWFDSINEKLFEWNGIMYVETFGIAYLTLVMLRNFTCQDCKGTFVNVNRLTDTNRPPIAKDVLRVATKEKGCGVEFEICMTGDQNFVLGKLSQNIIYFEAVKGYSKLDSGPMYLQVGVGTNGSPDERRLLHSTIRSFLGGSGIRVELTKNDIDECIDDALVMLRKYSSHAYDRGFFFLKLNPNQQTYLLRDKCVGFNKITHINTIYRSRGSFGGLTDNSVFNTAIIQSLYNTGTFDMLTYHLVAQYIDEINILFAQDIMFNWYESTRELKIYKRIYNFEKVLLDVSTERTEQQLFSDRNTKNWVKNWAVAKAKLMLSQIRGKYLNLGGPNGSTSLNASDLIQQATEEMEKLTEEIKNGVMQNISGNGSGAFFLFG